MKRVLVAALLAVFMSASTMAQEKEIDPTDLMQTVNYLEVGYERQKQNYGRLSGNLDILRFEYDWAPAPGNLLVIEGGFGDSSVDDIGDSGWIDTRLRYFNLAWTLDESEDPGWKKVGWSVESYLPTGDIDKGTGLDQWVAAPGIVGAYQVTPALRVYPILS